MTAIEKTQPGTSETAEREPGRLGRVMYTLLELLANLAISQGTRSENVYGREKAHELWPHTRRVGDVTPHQVSDQS